MAYGKKIYLAGGQQFSNDKGIGWRRMVTPKLNEMGFDVFDPTLHENPVRQRHGDDWERRCAEDENFRCLLAGELIDYDFNIMKETDALLVNWDESAIRGGGTKSEITWSRKFSLPCYVVVAEGISRDTIPLWTWGGIRNPKNVVHSFDEALERIESDFEEYVSKWKSDMVVTEWYYSGVRPSV